MLWNIKGDKQVNEIVYRFLVYAGIRVFNLKAFLGDLRHVYIKIEHFIDWD